MRYRSRQIGRTLVGMVLAAVLGLGAAAQPVDFTGSHLPIVVLDTEGQAIPDEPKIMARMGVIDNGPGQRNHVDDPFNAYDGWIGIEKRGSSSQFFFPKKQYAVETRQADGSNRNVALLGFPEENDWILHAPYSDKSLMRNVLVYTLARRLGWYASRTRYCEVVLNGDYQGVYVLMETIKWDDNRVDIARLRPDEVSGDDLTGGYIVKVDKTDGADVSGWWSAYPAPANPARGIFYQYHYPRPDEIVPAQEAYIQAFIEGFEDLMHSPDFADPARGYPSMLDVASFVDYFILNEVSRNVDGYRLSAFLYKDKDSTDGRLVMGPVWDYNLAFGNADYYNGSGIAGFQVDFAVAEDAFHLPFWWGRLLEDPAFAEAIEVRWRDLRQTILHSDSLTAWVDATAASLGEAQARNFQRWPVFGEYVWPNAYVGASYEDEVDYLKRWMRDRLVWLDEHIGEAARVGTETRSLLGGRDVRLVGPNPFVQSTRLEVEVAAPQPVRIEVVDVLGRPVAMLHEGGMEGRRRYVFAVDGQALAAGVYLLRVQGRRFVEVRSLVKVR